MQLTREFLNKEFDKYVERPFIILDFTIFITLLLPMLWKFNDTALAIFHFMDISIWILILVEVIFKLMVVPSWVDYFAHNWEDVICALLPILPNLKIIKELRYIHFSNITHSLKIVRLAAFTKRIHRRLSLILK